MIYGIILIVVVIIGYYYLRNKGRSGNPLTTIRKDGCLGFKIGDRKDFVMSRIKHLNLLTATDKDYLQMSNQMRLPTNYITTSTDFFNNIKTITFHFTSNEILSSIHISMKEEQCDFKTLRQIVAKYIINALGENTYSANNISTWVNQNNVVSLGYVENSLYVNISDMRYS